MSGAKEVATRAVEHIEPLLAEMFDHDYADNEMALGTVTSGKEEIQIQLKITRIEKDFIG